MHRDGVAVGTSTTSWIERAPLVTGRSCSYTVDASNAWGSSAPSAPASAVGVWATADDAEPATQPVAVPRPIDDSCPADSIGEDGFADVASSSPHEPSVYCVAQWRITKGTTAGRFSPHELVTRGQMAAFVGRMITEAGGTLPEPRRDHFVDDDGLVLEPDINKAAAAGFTGGFGDGTYRPGDGVRRDHMASFLARVLDLIVESGMSGVPQREAAAG